MDGIITNSPPKSELSKILFLEMADFYNIKNKLDVHGIRSDLKHLLLKIQIK